MLFVSLTSGCALFTEVQYKTDIKVVEIPDRLTSRLVAPTPPSFNELVSLPRTELINLLLDRESLYVEEISKGNLQFQNIEEYIERQKVIYAGEGE